MIRICRCSYCSFESENEQEVIEHERSHSKTMQCTKFQQKNEVPCMLSILDTPHEDGNFFEFTWTWEAGATDKETPRTMSSKYLVDKAKFVDIIEDFLPTGYERKETNN